MLWWVRKLGQITISGKMVVTSQQKTRFEKHGVEEPWLQNVLKKGVNHNQSSKMEGRLLIP